MKKAILILIICSSFFSCKEINKTDKNKKKSEVVEHTIKCSNRDAEFKIERIDENTYNVYSNVPLDRGNINGIVGIDGVTLRYAQKYQFSFAIAKMFDEKEVYNLMIKQIEEKYCEKGWN